MRFFAEMFPQSHYFWTLLTYGNTTGNALKNINLPMLFYKIEEVALVTVNII